MIRSQGFRKYVHKATDHAELLAFLLGQLVKEKVQLVMIQRGQEPASVEIPLAQLEARVSPVSPVLARRTFN
jgi:DNA replication licensing factor MCM2